MLGPLKSIAVFNWAAILDVAHLWQRKDHPSSALARAKLCGKEAEHHYRNNNGNPVFFELVGVRELICCDPACEPDEVWYETVEIVRPMERRRQIIPAESQLCAIRNDE